MWLSRIRQCWVPRTKFQEWYDQNSLYSAYKSQWVSNRLSCYLKVQTRMALIILTRICLLFLTHARISGSNSCLEVGLSLIWVVSEWVRMRSALKRKHRAFWSKSNSIPWLLYGVLALVYLWAKAMRPWLCTGTCAMQIKFRLRMECINATDLKIWQLKISNFFFSLKIPSLKMYRKKFTRPQPISTHVLEEDLDKSYASL